MLQYILHCLQTAEKNYNVCTFYDIIPIPKWSKKEDDFLCELDIGYIKIYISYFFSSQTGLLLPSLILHVSKFNFPASKRPSIAGKTSKIVPKPITEFKGVNKGAILFRIQTEKRQTYFSAGYFLVTAWI